MGIETRGFGLVVVWGGALLLGGCSPAKVVEPELVLSINPSKIKRDGSKTTVTVTATDESSQPGTGEVTIESSVGSLSTGTTVTLGAAGTASVQYSCDVTTDTGCSVDDVRLSAKWARAKAPINAAYTLRLSAVAQADGGSTCNGSFLTGAWRRSDGFEWTFAATGCAITGTGDTPAFLHSMSGTYNDVTGSMPFTVRRTTVANGCVTSVYQVLTRVDPTHVSLSTSGTDGNCELATNFTEVFDYVKQ